MSHSTISSESIATESLGSFVAYVILPYPAPVVFDSPVVSDSDSPPLTPSTLALIDDWFAALPSSPLLSYAHLGPSHRRPRSSPTSSAAPPPKRCRVSPTPTLPTTTELTVMAPALHFVHIELLPPYKRDDIGKDVKAVGIEARLKRVKDAMKRR
ncbi:hypothetical protein Tco_0089626 [Tanacetum coccineum]